MDQYEFVWADGIATRLTQLDQRRTYAGLLEGIPTLKINQLFHLDPLVSPPGKPERLLLWAPQHKVERWPETFMGSPTSSLPAIRCIATFDYFFTTRDEAGFASYIEVVWFQEDWAFPIIPEVLAKIKSLNWRDVAIDYEP